MNVRFLLMVIMALPSSFNSSNLVDAGDGREDGNGVYSKADQANNAGVVYTVAGASGKISGGNLNHPAMFTSFKPTRFGYTGCQ